MQKPAGIHPRDRIVRERFAKRAFTLIEIMVVVTIIALLISILVPSLQGARREARKVVCASNLRSCGQGFYFYTQANKSFLPDSGQWMEKLRPTMQNSLFQKVTVQIDPEWLVDECYEVEVYYCPDDAKKCVKEIDKNRQYFKNTSTNIKLGLAFSYVINENATWPLFYSPSTAAQLQDYSVIPVSKRFYGNPSSGNSYAINMRKISEIKRTSDVLILTDGGDDEAGVGSNTATDCQGNHSDGNDRAEWDYDEAWDQPGFQHPNPALEIHHKTGNNFLYFDGHVGYVKIAHGMLRDGVPKVPMAWVPELLNVPAKPPVR